MSTTMAGERVQYEKHLSCPVCMELLTDPRALPCMHTFCVHCLQSHITSMCTSGREFLCPVCRANTKPPVRGLHPNSWAENFPLNFPLKAIVDEVRSNKQKETEDRMTNKTVKTKCQIHADREKAFICCDHNARICSQCRESDHNHCAHVQGLERGSENKNNDTTMEVQETIIEYVGEVPTNTEVLLGTVQETEPTSQKSEIREPVHRRVNRICNNKGRRNVELSSGGSPGDCRRQSQKLTDDFSRARSFDDISLTWRFQSDDSCIKRPLSRISGIKGARQSAVNSTPSPNRHSVAFTGPDLERALGLGQEMVVVNVDTDVSKKQIYQTGEYCVRTKHDRKCCSIISMAVMPDNRVLLADENNVSLKLFSANGSFISYVKLTSEPWDVTSVEQYEAAVTCPEDKTIHFALVDESVSLCRSLTLDKKCFGIAYHKSELFVALETEIRILKYDGEIVRKIVSEPLKKKLFSFATQKTLFRGARYLCYDGSGLAGVLHVADCEKSCLTAFDRKGGLMSRMRLEEDGAPLAMSLGEKGQLFVCQAPNKLMTISIVEHGNHIRPLVTVDNILSVEYNKSSKQLLVTRRRNNYVKIYTVKT